MSPRPLLFQPLLGGDERSWRWWCGRASESWRRCSPGEWCWLSAPITPPFLNYRHAGIPLLSPGPCFGLYFCYGYCGVARMGGEWDWNADFIYLVSIWYFSGSFSVHIQI
jgi:hypothetical protein